MEGALIRFPNRDDDHKGSILIESTRKGLTTLMLAGWESDTGGTGLVPPPSYGVDEERESPSSSIRSESGFVEYGSGSEALLIGEGSALLSQCVAISQQVEKWNREIRS